MFCICSRHTPVWVCVFFFAKNLMILLIVYCNKLNEDNIYPTQLLFEFTFIFTAMIIYNKYVGNLSVVGKHPQITVTFKAFKGFFS